MAKLRIFELARELEVTSKDVLGKCRAEDIDVKNHMSTVSAGLEATIRQWFSESEGLSGTAVEITEHVDVTKAKAKAKKSRSRRSKKSEPVADTETQTEAIVEPATEVPPEKIDEPQAPAVVPDEKVAPAPTGKPEPQPKPTGKDKEVKPAGPQVKPTPVKLKGPRVVRVERPESVEISRPRYRPRQNAAATTTQPATDDAKATKRKRGGKTTEAGSTETSTWSGDKKPKKRSPRRRSATTTTDGKEKIKEWRNADLAEREQRLASAGGGLRRHRANVARGSGLAPTSKTGSVDIAEPITVKSLSEATGIKSAQLIKNLMELGVMATVNQVIAREMAETVVTDYGIELAVRRARSAENELLESIESRIGGETRLRAPVVTFLGHVDHGKTSLLDSIRNTTVVDGESGGITQHIGAYRYDRDDKHVVFLDTPGHEAFTAMRSRGANMTDVVVLVVAADDGVMPQTAEAISHAKAAEVPIVIALNKIDLPNANVQRALGQLAEHGLNVRQWGGEVELVETSATTGKGIDDLIEVLNLEAEILELKADPSAPAQGYVIESQVDPGRGVVARLLVRDGTLRIGDVLLAGCGFGRVRQMIDSHGKPVTEAGPSTPVEVSGLGEVPNAGDKFYQVDNIELARQIADDRKQQNRSAALATAGPVTAENIFTHIEDGRIDEVPLIIKADVQGSIEAITGSLEKLSTEEIRVNVLHSAVGGISTGDITLAEASSAIIVGFNVVPDSSARIMAEDKGVSVQLYRVIYDIVDDFRRILSEGLAPEIRQETLGRAEVRQVFKVTKVGTVAGCYVTEGKVVRNAKVRVTRDNVVIEDNRAMESLKRFKEDVREARNGMECGIKIAAYDDVKEGDILEFYQQTEVARTL